MLIALCGYARSGKDTAADHFIKNKIVSKRYGYADPIKNIVNTLFDWDDRHSDGDLKETELDCFMTGDSCFKAMLLPELIKIGENYNLNPFEIIQWLLDELDMKPSNPYYSGKCSPRKAYQRFGTEVGRNKISESIWLDMAPKSNIIITDVRFPNEYDYIKKNKIPLLKIVRTDGKTIKNTGHPSEAYIDSFEPDCLVENPMTPKFFDNLDEALKKVV